VISAEEKTLEFGLEFDISMFVRVTSVSRDSVSPLRGFQLFGQVAKKKCFELPVLVEC